MTMETVLQPVTQIGTILEPSQPPIVVGTLLGTGIAGPPGPAGATGIQVPAAVPIGGNRVVYTDANFEARYADPSDAATYATIVGVTEGAASAGDMLTIMRTGVMTEGGWSWTPGALVYLGTNGTLTQTVPTSGALVVIGSAINATKLLIDIQQRFILG